jgi:hypothetical protein
MRSMAQTLEETVTTVNVRRQLGRRHFETLHRQSARGQRPQVARQRFVCELWLS